MFAVRSVRQRLPRWLCIVVVAASLAGCGRGAPGRITERQSPLDRWSLAVVSGDYDAARRLLAPDDAARWEAQTSNLSREHGAVKSYQRSSAPVELESVATDRIVLTWADGFERCLLVRAGPSGPVDVAGEGYRGCAGLGGADEL